MPCVQKLALPHLGWLDILCSQIPSFAFLLATTGTKRIYDLPASSSKTMITRRSCRNRDYCKRKAMGVYIYVEVFYCSTSIILPCIFWGFYDHMKLIHLGKEFLCYHFWFIYFILAHSSWQKIWCMPVFWKTWKAFQTPHEFYLCWFCGKELVK